MMLWGASLEAQNPNWTMPPDKFAPAPSLYTPLPSGTIPGIEYDGAPATNLHAGFSDNNGNLLFFTVDDKVYNAQGDLAGWITDDMLRKKRGYNERLILPMGKSCTRFAILTSGGHDYVLGRESFKKIDRGRLYMSIYNTEIEIGGGLEKYGVPPYDYTAVDISQRDGPQHFVYGNWSENSGVQADCNAIYMASSKLIDDCFYYVFISDGLNLIRYKLSEEGLKWDNYTFKYAHTNYHFYRTEMEMVELPNGNYRIAAPYRQSTNSTGDDIEYGFSIMDLNSDFEVVAASVQHASVGNHRLLSGVEFDATGRYLYVTSEKNSSNQTALNVWDVEEEEWVDVPGLQDADDFEYSYIERYGNNLYMANSNWIGKLSDPSNPTSANFQFEANFLPISPGYGNDVGPNPQWGSNDHFRYTLPDQIDDGDYGDLDDRSCDCCETWNSLAGTESYTATQSDTWTPDDNPFMPGSSDIRFKGELRIPKGVNITIKDMNFHFKEEGIVVVERGDASTAGGTLILDDSRLTADLSCAGRVFPGDMECRVTDPEDDPDQQGRSSAECRRKLWQGVRVLGHPSLNQTGAEGDKQGRLIMENSTIEFAEIGVRVGLGGGNTGGGQVRIVNSTFKDNPLGLVFEPYVRDMTGPELFNRSATTQTHFVWTSDLRSFPEAAPIRHVSIRESSGIKLEANRYENADWEYYAPIDRGTGVYTANSRHHEVWRCTSSQVPCPESSLFRSEFLNLETGLYATGDPANTRKVEAHYGVYHNNRMGVTLRYRTAPDVLDNEFDVPNLENTAGLWMVNSTGYAVENNDFRGMVASNFNYNFGIVIWDSGPEANEIYRNHFENLGTGIASAGVNAKDPEFDDGLEWKCNTFDQIIAYSDIYVSQGTVSDEQGTCHDGVTGPAGNFFSHSHQVSNDHMDIRVDLPSGLEIIYSHHDLSSIFGGTEVRLKPLVYTHFDVDPSFPNYVHLASCGGVEPGGTMCRPKKSGAPPGMGTHPEFLGITASSPSALEGYTSDLADLYAGLAATTAVLDGGHTEELVAAIYAGNDPASISAMLAEAGNMVSTRVIEALLKADNPAMQALGETLGAQWTGNTLSSGQFDYSALPSAETENQWRQLRQSEVEIWGEIVDGYGKDTVNAYPQADLIALMNTYEPNASQRFCAALFATAGLPVPDWIRPGNNAFLPTSGASLPQVDAEGNLPLNIDALFESGFFGNLSDAAALHSLYIEADREYLAYCPQPHFALSKSGADDGAKSGDSAESAEAGEGVSLHPNPFNETLTVSTHFGAEEGATVQLVIYDVLGRQVYAAKLPAQTEHLIDGDNLPKGVLIYTISQNGKVVQTGKLIRE